MNARQHLGRGLIELRQHRDDVAIAGLAELGIAAPAVGVNGFAIAEVVADEGGEDIGRNIGDHTKANPIAHWRATEGPERELIFRQEHPPGEQALSDFTDASSLAVTIDGTPFPHLLYHFWLAFSGWQYVKAIQGGESFSSPR